MKITSKQSIRLSQVCVLVFAVLLPIKGLGRGARLASTARRARPR